MGYYACDILQRMRLIAVALVPATLSLGVELQTERSSAVGNHTEQQNGSAVSVAFGGAAQADFDSLIELIQSTVATDSWLENGTGEGEIEPFPGGVYIDTTGTLRLSITKTTDKSQTTVNSSASRQVSAAALLEDPKITTSDSISHNARTPSKLRFVSLLRLERAIAIQQRRHLPLSIDMLTLAGMQRVEYVMIGPGSDNFPKGDLILAGPAGDWRVESNGRIVSREFGRPIVRLDDLLVLLRRAQITQQTSFGCSITPKQARLAVMQDYLQQTGQQPLEPGGRNRWLNGLRDTLGKQDVEFFGINPQTHVAQVLLAADYHMKLIGMGLVDGVDEVESYLATIRLSPKRTLPALSILRWWFTMKYDPVATNTAHDIYQIIGPGVQVLSENELLVARGRRVHTGQSDELNHRFASRFTDAFEQLARKFPIYTELKNLFDLALVVALLETEGIFERVGWQHGLLLDSCRLRLPVVVTPKHVETIINHRVIRGRHILAGVSGGVWLDTKKSLRLQKMEQAAEAATDRSQLLAPNQVNKRIWWWD